MASLQKSTLENGRQGNLQEVIVALMKLPHLLLVLGEFLVEHVSIEVSLDSNIYLRTRLKGLCSIRWYVGHLKR